MAGMCGMFQVVHFPSQRRECGFNHIKQGRNFRGRHVLTAVGIHPAF